MSKKPRFKEAFDKQDKQICTTALLPYSLITAKLMELEKSLLLTCQILGLLVDILSADEKYAVLNRDNLTIPMQMQLSQKKKDFLNFLLRIWNLD